MTQEKQNDCINRKNGDNCICEQCYPAKQRNWRSEFLEAGTREVGMDLSVLISTVSGIIQKEGEKLKAEIEKIPDSFPDYESDEFDEGVRFCKKAIKALID